MKNKILLVIFLLTECLYLSANYLLNISANRAAVAEVDLLINSAESIYFLPSQQTSKLSSSFTKPFSFGEITCSTISYCNIRNNLGYGIVQNNVMSDYFSSYITSCNISYRIFKELIVGFNQKIIYCVEEIEKYRRYVNDCSFTFENEDKCFSCSVNNIFGIASKYIDLPRLITILGSYDIAKNITFGGGIQYSKDELEEIFATSYKMSNKIELDTGYYIHKNQFTFGIGIRMYKFNICYAIMTHPILDLSHYVSIEYEL